MATAASTKTKATAAKKTAASRKTTAKKTQAKKAAPAPQTRIERAREAAERLVVVPVGAALEARDTVVATAEDLQTRFGTAEAAEKQLEKQIKKYEKRGEKARKNVERRVKKTRTTAERRVKKTRKNVERELKLRRREAEKLVEQTTKDANARLDAVRESVRQIDLGTSVEFLQAQAEQVVKTGQEAGAEAVRRVSERIAS
jgi:F0F1-type ATP synthase membrane subunit b/b'